MCPARVNLHDVRAETGSHRGRRNDHGDGISTGVQQKGRVTTHSADGALLGPLVKEIYAVRESG